VLYDAARPIHHPSANALPPAKGVRDNFLISRRI
jgi:hypothetical protein